MFTITSAILFSAFYSLYYTSKRVPLTYNLGVERWMHDNPKPTKITGVILLIIAYVLCLYISALGSGSLLFMIELMTIGSLIIILKPLKIVPLKNIAILFIVLEVLEMYYS